MDSTKCLEDQKLLPEQLKDYYLFTKTIVLLKL